tara:strand:+ start:748 stop:894 length:147 start_codon:yes stop_codon:yes gene_type:complete
MGVCMSFEVGNNQIAPEEDDDNMEFLKEKMQDNSCGSCLKKIFCFLCI